MADVNTTTMTHEVENLRRSFESTVNVEENDRDKNTLTIESNTNLQSSTPVATSSAPGVLATATHPSKTDSKRKNRESSSHTNLSGNNPEPKRSRLNPKQITPVIMTEIQPNAMPTDQAQTTDQQTTQMVPSRSTHDLEDTEVDHFERYVTANQLPFYRAARCKMLAHGRLACRLAYYDLCQSELLSPYVLSYRPTPPQRIELTPTKITEWKDSIIQCEQSMLLVTIHTDYQTTQKPGIRLRPV